MRKSVLVLGVALLCARVAGAEPITLSGGGTLDRACCFGTAGGPFTFSLSFDGVSADQDMDPARGQYELGTGVLAVQLGTWEFTLPSQAVGYVRNDPLEDALDIYANSLGPPDDYVAPLQMVLRAYSTTGDWLDGDLWPNDLAATLNAASSTRFELWPVCEDCEDPLAEAFSVRFTSGSSPGAAVPEPTSLVLLGTGLVCLAARRWRQRSG